MNHACVRTRIVGNEFGGARPPMLLIDGLGILVNFLTNFWTNSEKLRNWSGLVPKQIQDQKIKKLVSKNNWSGIGQEIGPTQFFPNMCNWSETNFILDQSGLKLF